MARPIPDRRIVGLVFALIGCNPSPMRETITFGDHDAKASAVDCHKLVDVDAAERDAATHSVSTADAAGPRPDDWLCDGSSVLQVAASTSYGSGNLLGPFYEPHGSFFAIGGSCHFYAQTEPMLGVHSGKLAIDQQHRSFAELRLDAIGSLESTSSCAGTSISTVATSGVRLSCSCGHCGGDALATEVLARAEDWIGDLATQGSPIAGPVRALAVPREPPVLYCGKTQLIAEWPLARSMRDLPGLVAETTNAAGALIEQEQEYTTLRALRTATAARFVLPKLPPSEVFVRDDGIVYALQIRDELPPQIERSLTELLRAPH